MPNPLNALSELVESCRSGDFYRDYDESCRLIREADAAIATLAQLVDGVVDAVISTAERGGLPIGMATNGMTRDDFGLPGVRIGRVNP